MRDLNCKRADYIRGSAEHCLLVAIPIMSQFGFLCVLCGVSLRSLRLSLLTCRAAADASPAFLLYSGVYAFGFPNPPQDRPRALRWRHGHTALFQRDFHQPLL